MFLEVGEVELALRWLLEISFFCELEEHEEEHETDCRPSTAEIWGYSVLATFVITIVSLCGVMGIPFTQSKYYNGVMHFFLALSSGTMFGDALIHIVPVMAGLHSHGEEAVLSEEGHDSHGHAAEEPAHEEETAADILTETGPLILCAAFIMVFFVLEKVIIRCTGHSHTHGGHAHGAHPPKMDKKLEMVEVDMPVDMPSSTTETPEDSLAEIRPAGYLLLIGDGLHNLVDGLAIGAAFSSSFDLGIATSLAVLIHEVPQEFGDFALLIQSGFSRTKALLFNLASGGVAMLGTFIGCGIGSVEGAEPWILSLVAGSFFYISLCTVIPVLHEEPSLKVQCVQLVGMTLGILIMVGIAAFEVVKVNVC
jgi:zinc transporter ZupT